MLKKCILVVVMTVLLTVALSGAYAGGSLFKIQVTNTTSFPIKLKVDAVFCLAGAPSKGTELLIPPNKELVFTVNTVTSGSCWGANSSLYYTLFLYGDELCSVHINECCIGQTWDTQYYPQKLEYSITIDSSSNGYGASLIFKPNMPATLASHGSFKNPNNKIIDISNNMTGDDSFFWSSNYYLGQGSDITAYISALIFYKIPDDGNQYLLLGTKNNGFAIGSWDKKTGVLAVDGCRLYNTTTPNCSLPSNDITAATVVSVSGDYSVAVIGTSNGLMIARLDGQNIEYAKTYLLGHSISTVAVFDDNYLLVTYTDATTGAGEFLEGMFLPSFKSFSSSKLKNNCRR